MSAATGTAVAAAAFVTALGIALWSEVGATVFIATAVAGLVSCF